MLFFLPQGHGWCIKGADCPRSHDVDLILDAEDWVMTKKKKKKSRPRKKKQAVPQALKSTTREDGDNDDDDDESSEDDEVDLTLPDAATTLVEHETSKIESMQIDDGTALLLSSDISGTKIGVSGDSNSFKNSGDIVNDVFHKTVAAVNRASGHRAGFDAFMTGYIFASFSAQKEMLPKEAKFIDEFANKIYLGGKDFPLQVMQSNFAKPSRAHVDKWLRIERSIDGSTAL